MREKEKMVIILMHVIGYARRRCRGLRDTAGVPPTCRAERFPLLDYVEKENNDLKTTQEITRGTNVVIFRLGPNPDLTLFFFPSSILLLLLLLLLLFCILRPDLFYRYFWF